MDLVIFGVETKLVKMDIISSIPDEVADYVMNELSRGVSRQTIIGGYTHHAWRNEKAECSSGLLCISTVYKEFALACSSALKI